MKKTKKNPDVDQFQLATPVSSRVQILEVRQIEGSFSHTPLAHQGKQKIDILTEATGGLERGKDILVFAKFELTGKPEDSDEESVNIKSTYLIFYRIESSEGLSGSNYDAFAKTNGIYNAWPYCRPHTIPTLRCKRPPWLRSQARIA